MNYDEVNRPKGYNFHEDELAEPINVIKGLGLQYAFCIGNSIKYICRYKYKGGKKDLEKSLWYLKRSIASDDKEPSLYNSVKLAGIWDLSPAMAEVLSDIMVFNVQDAISKLETVIENNLY